MRLNSDGRPHFLAGSPLYHPTGFLPPVRHPWLHCLYALHRNIYLFYYYFKNSEVLIKMFISKSSKVVLPKAFGRYRPWRGQRLPDSQRPVAYWNVPSHLIYTVDSYRIPGWGHLRSTRLWSLLPEENLSQEFDASVLLFELHRKAAQTLTDSSRLQPPSLIKTSPSSAQFFHFLYLNPNIYKAENVTVQKGICFLKTQSKATGLKEVKRFCLERFPETSRAFISGV